MRRFLCAFVALILVCGLVSGAAANEYTDVIDAFDWDVGDPFDANLFLGYERIHRQAHITRETFDERSVPSKSDYYNYVDMFRYKQTVHVLQTGIDLGIYKDLALRTRLPIILEDARSLKATSDLFWHDANGDGTDDQLWEDDVKSHDRSGLDHIALGLWWGILDQGRDDTKPNWTMFVEGRLGLGAPQKVSCKGCTGNFGNKRGGASRGYNELAIGMRLSRRYRFLDPYFGFEGVVAWFKDKDSLFPEGTTTGVINDRPPILGRMDFGMEIIPWEQPEAYRKLVISLGAGAVYHSEGRERTPLFDAIGSSEYFADQSYVDLNRNDVNDGGEEVDAVDEDYYNSAGWGMSDVENYATFYGQLFVAMQVAKYVKFRVGSSIAGETDHFITKTDVCASNSGGSGECLDPNPTHRPEIDISGNRFRQENTLLWTFFLDVTAMF